MRHRMRRLLTAVATAMLAATLAGCGMSIPADPEGTLDRVSGGEQRIGASPDPGLVDVE